jgi:hypothetical protein
MGEQRKVILNPDTGLTIAEEIARKSAETMKNNGWYGSDKHKSLLPTYTQNVASKRKRGSLISKSLLRIDDSTGKSVSRLAVEKQIQTKIDRGIYSHPSTKDEFELYRDEVRRLSEKNDLTILEGFSSRGRAGIPGATHLDHIFSIKGGFMNNVPPEIIASICNLRFISYEENISKHDKCHIELNTLLELHKNSKNK